MIQTVEDGVFCAEQHQVAAIKVVHKLGEQIAAAYPELANWYRDLEKPFTAREVAELLIPEECTISLPAAVAAIHHAVRLLVPVDDREIIRHIRQSERSTDFMLGMTEEQRSALSTRATQARIDRLIPIDVTAMLTARGMKIWTRQEDELLFQLIHDPMYRKNPPRGGRDYEKIAQTLNDQFHNGQPVRHGNSCVSRVSETKRRKIRVAKRKMPTI